MLADALSRLPRVREDIPDVVLEAPAAMLSVTPLTSLLATFPAAAASWTRACWTLCAAALPAGSGAQQACALAAMAPPVLAVSAR